MQINRIKSGLPGEEYSVIKHPSGLDLLLYPMQGFTGTYACFVTKYGSIDTAFKFAGENEFTEVPEGIAHFLEHKLFEGEDGEDAFNRFAETGANANAYTSFDRTAYLFSCTDNFAASLEILLDFVTHPYFTQETVQKEQGIIGQEIRMEEDNPDWRVFFNLLSAVYHNNPVRIDIAGTVDSIAQIDADLLHRCYKMFYNLNNMALVVAGNFSEQEVIAVADKILKPAPEFTIERKRFDEPREIRTDYIEQVLPVATPIFHIGFKADAAATEDELLKNQMLDELLVEILTGEASPLYRHMYDSGLINATFSAEVMVGRGFSLAIFSGESREPIRVKEELIVELERCKREGLDPVVFDCCKKAAYGRYIGTFARTEAVAGVMAHCHFAGIQVWQILDFIAGITPEQLAARLMLLEPGRCALSVIHA